MVMKQSQISRIFDMYDYRWVKRQRRINTAEIFRNLTESGFTRKGVEHVIKEKGVDYSPAAFCKARQKLPPNAFDTIRRNVLSEIGNNSHVYAVDGSKVHAPASFVNQGFKSRTNDQDVKRKAKRPLAMLSSMIDVHTGLCIDFVLSRHFNERLSALEHLS